MINNHWISLKHHDSQPLPQHNTTWFPTTNIAQNDSQPPAHYVVNHGILCWAVAVNHGELWWASGCASWCDIRSQWLWIKVYYTEPSGCESCCFILCQWFWISVLCWASGCESWWVILSQWLWIILFYWASGCESWCVILSQWLWITVSYDERVVVHHGVLYWVSGCDIIHHDSNPQAQHSTTWFTTTALRNIPSFTTTG
jgi:hypothetical protein